MNKKWLFTVLLFGSLFAGNQSHAQVQPFYKLPDSYAFDYEVTQAFTGRKNAADTSVMHFFYTKSGEYAAAVIGRKSGTKGNLTIIMTRDGNSIILDEHKKSITVISIRKIISDLAGLAKWIRMDSVMAHLQKKPDGREIQSVKTGNNRAVGSYTSEEYSVSENKGRKGSVWVAKVDFNTQVDYILGVAGANLLKMMGGQMKTNPLFQAITQPKTLVTEMQFRDSAGGKGMEMHTISIRQTPTTISTAGYTVNNYSNMTLPEIFQAEMKKRND